MNHHSACAETDLGFLSRSSANEKYTQIGAEYNWMIEERGSENSIMENKKREMKLSKQRYLTFFFTVKLAPLYILKERSTYWRKSLYSTIIHVHITFGKFSFLVLTKFLGNSRFSTQHYKILRRLEPSYLLNSPGGGTPGNTWWGCAARFSKS